MRRIILASLLFLAACAPDPVPPARTPVPVPQPVQAPHVAGEILGMDAPQLLRMFGLPALQVREGVGQKMQWRGIACVLDAYLYPPAGGAGPARVTHVDARLPSGADASHPSCIAALQAR